MLSGVPASVFAVKIRPSGPVPHGFTFRPVPTLGFQRTQRTVRATAGSEEIAWTGKGGATEADLLSVLASAPGFEVCRRFDGGACPCWMECVNSWAISRCPV